MNLQIQTPRWCVPLLEPKRYKGAKGGRGCVHPDTLIDTPDGQIKIKDFKGGSVYSYNEGKKIITKASKPKRYSKEQLYLVELSNGSSIITTDEHKFLTPTGYIELLSLSNSCEVVCEIDQDVLNLRQTNSDIYLKELQQDVYRCFQTILNYQGDYSLDYHLYDELLLYLLSSDLFSFPLQVDELQHSFRASCRSDVQTSSYKNILSSLLYRQQNSDAHLISGVQSFEDLENHIYEMFSVLLLDFYQSFQLSHEKNTHPLRDCILEVIRLCFETSKNQDKNQEKECYTFLFAFYDVLSFCKPFFICFSDFNIVKINSITKHDRLKYWDVHVPIYNNYLSNGIVNHNSGKSHFFAEGIIEALVINPNTSAVCIREVQKSLKFSAKRLIEQKIEDLDVADYFKVLDSEIRSTRGNGVIIFQGMQDHTAESIKSLEGFKIAWVEEAQSLSYKSLKLLRPTIRMQDSELWFSWNPNLKTDAIEKFFSVVSDDMALVHVNSEQNPFLPKTLRKERDSDRIRMSPEDYEHVWNGGYNLKSDALVFKNKYEVDFFEPLPQWTRLQGLDWGFSQDPTTANVIYLDGNNLYIRYEANKIGLELDDTAEFILNRIPDFEKYITRADNARPESISFVKRKGLPKLIGEPKLKIEDGVQHMKSFNNIIIHPECVETIKEFGLYSYKIDKRSGDVLPVIDDKNNHHIDDIRYALYPIIKNKQNHVKIRV